MPNKSKKDAKVKTKFKTTQSLNKDPYHTIGCIREIRVTRGKTILIKIEPSDEFAFGPDESDPKRIRKLILTNTSETGAMLVDLNTSFKIGVSNLRMNILCALKKDGARIRVVVDVQASDFTIIELAII